MDAVCCGFAGKSGFVDRFLEKLPQTLEKTAAGFVQGLRQFCSRPAAVLLKTSGSFLKD